MFKNRGQITIFLIVGMIILFSIGFGFYLININEQTVVEIEKFDTIPLEIQPIKLYIEQCIEDVTEEIISIIALQGGYYGIPSYPLEYLISELDLSIYLPYYYYNYENSVIEKTQLEEELSNGIKDNIEKCMNLTKFNIQKSIDLEKLNLETQLFDNKAKITMNLPIDILIDESISRINKFNIELNTDYLNKYKLANTITEKQVVNGNELCLTCISDFVNKTDFLLDMVEIETEEHYIIIYTISNPETYSVFNFAHRFNLNDTPSNFVEIKPIETINATIGNIFEYQIIAMGNNITYFDDTELFDIENNTGMIKFIPKYEDSGNHIIIITVEDDLGNREDEIFTLLIEDFGTKPTIEYIGCQEATIGIEFTYKINASVSINQNLTYLDDSVLFNINRNSGLIEFIPSNSGEFLFNITVIDENSNYDIEEGCLIIRE